jgi:hypothetical protein
MEYSRIFFNRATNFNLNEHIHVTPSNQSFLATTVHEGSNFYFHIINLSIFMCHKVEQLFFKRASNFNCDEHIHVTPKNH